MELTFVLFSFSSRRGFKEREGGGLGERSGTRDKAGRS